jgi:hypothetical protein
LFGAHQFLLHPLFLAVAWTKLYGFPMDPRLWAAFFLHDVGYIGKENLDGAEGETHPELGGRIMAVLFGESWGEFTKLHSRFFASAQTIRDGDLTSLLGCDIGLFLYDGTELDSGTVVEFMFSKFADIPSVIVRTDFRNAGDSISGDPWNLVADPTAKDRGLLKELRKPEVTRLL